MAIITNNSLLLRSVYPQSVGDAVAATSEDWDAEDTQFTYDGNGNVIEMLENGQPAISALTYDHRNLPVRLVNRHER
ncbi:MAG: hypothetical protein D6732_09290 [Methanobacteriota archaeon]|nr:MAG: hypothetical protein D6732_09290 [Euryarchaeota archaeon]